MHPSISVHLILFWNLADERRTFQEFWPKFRWKSSCIHLSLWVSRVLKYPKVFRGFDNIFHVYLMRWFQKNSISFIVLESFHQVDMKKVVKSSKHFFGYFNTLHTHSVCLLAILRQRVLSVLGYFKKTKISWLRKCVDSEIKLFKRRSIFSK